MQPDVSHEIEQQIASRFIGTQRHPCSVCRDEVRQSLREPWDVRAGTVRRDVGGLVTVTCHEHEEEAA